MNFVAVKGLSYNIAGQVTGDSLSNGVTEQFGYDPARLRMTSQKAGTASPYTNRMDLTYSYSASSGQMGVGSTAGNAGQLMGITSTSTINGTTESASYTYDNYGRLATSNQTSNGTSAQRRFDYDRWGNRTAVWDATSGGNLIQRIALEQSSGIPSNRVASVHSAANNVAAASNGATASASSTYSSGTPASGAIDGDHKGLNWGSGGGWSDNTANSYPDWLQINFSGSKPISEVDVYSIQDNYSSPSEPDETMQFNNYGVTDFAVQSWNGSSWQTVTGGSISGNRKVWCRVNFPTVTTDKIRITISGTADGLSRLAEVEAYEYDYDAAGNVTNDGQHTYTYDSENRLVSVDGGGTASYAYDQQNRRYKATVGNTVTHYVWQGSQVMSEYNGSTGAVLADYIYSGSRMIAKVASGTTSYCLSDRLSARLTLDTSGAVVGRQAHLPFGEDFAESGTQQKQHFTSYEPDSESGLDYAVNRQHQPAIGRFMQADHYRVSGGAADPQSWNRYAYAGNDPVNFTDPSGLKRMYFVLNFYMADPSYNAYGYMDVPDGNSSPEDGMGTGSSKEDRIYRAAKIAANIFKEDNPCTTFFGGKDAANAALKVFLDATPTADFHGPITTSIQTSFASQPTTQTINGYTIRSPLDVKVNPDG